MKYITSQLPTDRRGSASPHSDSRPPCDSETECLGVVAPRCVSSVDDRPASGRTSAPKRRRRRRTARRNRQPIQGRDGHRVSDCADQRGRRRHAGSDGCGAARLPEQVDQLLARLAKAVFRLEERHAVVLQVRVGDRVRLPGRHKPAESHRQGTGAVVRLAVPRGQRQTVFWLEGKLKFYFRGLG